MDCGFQVDYGTMRVVDAMVGKRKGLGMLGGFGEFGDVVMVEAMRP